MKVNTRFFVYIETRLRVLAKAALSNLWSISPTFYEQLLCQFPYAKKVQTLNVSTEKLLKRLLYEKDARKMLVKLTPCLQLQNVASSTISSLTVFSIY